MDEKIASNACSEQTKLLSTLFFPRSDTRKLEIISSSLFGQFVNSLTQALLLGLKGSKDGWETRKLTPIGEKTLLSLRVSAVVFNAPPIQEHERDSKFGLFCDVSQSPCSMGEGGGETTSHYFSATF